MRWAAALRTGMLAAALAGAITRCSSPPAHPADATLQQSQQSPSMRQSLSQSPSDIRPTQSQSMPPTEVQQDVQRAVDSFNAAAGGPVSGQQIALAAVLDEGQRSVQRHCAAATTTLRFEPVYSRLAPAPGWIPSQGTLSGAVYALPTLIRIYSGNRITGTDLTDLHIAVRDGQAWLPALCPS